MQNEFITYNPVVLGFVIDVVDYMLLRRLKNTIVESIRKVENDDRVYLWHPDHKEIPRLPGHAVASVAKYRPHGNFKLGKALEETVKLIDQLDYDMERHVFIFTDHTEVDWDRMDAAMRNIKSVNFTLHFIHLGDASESLETYVEKYGGFCELVKVAKEYGGGELENLISRSYSDEIPPEGCGKVNIEQLRRDYEYNYSPRKIVQSREDDEIHD